MSGVHIDSHTAMSAHQLAEGLVTLGALAISAAPLGAFLVQRRLSLLGDAMSHGILPGAAAGYLIAGLSAPAMAIGGLLAGIVVAFLSSMIARAVPIREDASLAGVYMMALALGALMMMAADADVDLVHVLFGDGVAIAPDRSAPILAASGFTVLLMPFLYRPLLADALDPAGDSVAARLLFLALVVINLISAFLAVGSLLGVAIMVFPAITARLWAATIDKMIWIAALLGVMGVGAGLAAAYLTHLPPGPTVVLALGLVFVISLFVGTSAGLITRRRQLHRPHLKA